MLKIGDFSRLAQVSVDTLRHYDTLGLLKPTEVDQQSDIYIFAHTDIVSATGDTFDLIFVKKFRQT
jgi:DNA-binding transcriptional MerR regulator